MAARRIFHDEDPPWSVIEVWQDGEVFTVALHTVRGTAKFSGSAEAVSKRLRAALEAVVPPPPDPEPAHSGRHCTVCGAFRRPDGVCANAKCVDATLDLRADLGRRIVAELKRLGVSFKVGGRLESIIGRVVGEK